MAVGLQEQQTLSELSEIAEKKRHNIEQILKEAIGSLPKTSGCICAHALRNARP